MHALCHHHPYYLKRVRDDAKEGEREDAQELCDGGIKSIAETGSAARAPSAARNAENARRAEMNDV